MGLLDKIKNFFKPSPPPKPVRERDRIKPVAVSNTGDAGIFTYTANGFTIAHKDEEYDVPWHEVEELVAYKLDLMAYDEICLDILHNGSKHTITEDTPGWHLFVEKTKSVYPGIDMYWDSKIVYPSFATNLTVLYQKRDNG
jgi:hypothetical protein